MPTVNRATNHSISDKLAKWAAIGNHPEAGPAAILPIVRAKWAAMGFHLKVILGVVAGFLIFFAAILAIAPSPAPSSGNSNYPKSYDEAAARRGASTPPPSPSATPLNRTPAEHLDRARSYLADPQRQYDLDQAKAELEQIPKDASEYAEARTLLTRIASGKIKLPSEFELSHAEAIDTLRQVSNEVTYGKLKKNADRFIGQAWAFTGKVLEIHEQGSTTTARIGIGGYGLDAIFVECRCATDFVEDNSVFVVGTVQGNYTYDTVAGWTLTIPRVKAVAMVKPTDGAKLRAAAQRR